jgi:excinuclease ABC subunit C
VYRFLDERSRVMYVGRATDLRQRVASYWGDLSDRRHLRRMVPQIAEVQAVPCASVHEAAWLERNLLERSRARWNRLRGGLEVPAYLQLVQRAGATDLVVAHERREGAGVRSFGPYLGGTRGRLAASGLDRALALSYAGRRSGGFDRDMARVRGVADGDLDERVATAVRVLEREPGALASVRAELVRRRDAASASLAFELAARVAAELEALEWLVAEQRVTVDGAGDTRVRAWADGVLVTFDVTDGRVSRWTQRRGTDVDAGAAAATPECWRAFAREAAELAARLSRAGRT